MRGLINGALLKFSTYLPKHLHGVRGFLAFAEQLAPNRRSHLVSRRNQEGIENSTPIERYVSLYPANTRFRI
ncbi:MAG TPA: hypothetical protein G4O12_07335 [Dehalococcoidia bacterium]|nr:hypothetical protein [Dehalococcoidia bacterium]